MSRRGGQRGAAILVAMLTVALVATLAGAALWRQWRALEVEGSERLLQESTWILNGAMDWVRLILREDSRGGTIDHLGEPWAVPLKESRLSSFLGLEPQDAAGREEVFLSGSIQDAQARMNFFNLVDNGKLSEPDLLAFQRLFHGLGLDPDLVPRLGERLLLALGSAADVAGEAPAALRPQRLEHLVVMGLPPQALALLRPHAVWLPSRTALNLNTAGEIVIEASIPAIDRAEARRLVAARDRAPLRSLAAAQRLLPADAPQLESSRFSLASRYFLASGQLRIDQRVIVEQSLLLRGPQEVQTIWRERLAARPAPSEPGTTPSLQ